MTNQNTLAELNSSMVLPAQMNMFPSTRFMGSKQNLLKGIWNVAADLKFDNVLDLFSGSGVVSYMFKTQGKQVFSNDYMAFSACFTKAFVENNGIFLTQEEVMGLCDTTIKTDNKVSTIFKGLYFSDEDNAFIDTVRANLMNIHNEYKRSLALSALVRACLKKRPRGIFTYTGHRYDDGRKDLKLTLKVHFIEAVRQLNAAVFDNGRENISFHKDAMSLKKKADLVYIDPPYFSALSDNEYVRRYHFVEGLVRDWHDVDMQWHTKTKKFKSYPTPFSSLKTTYEAFDSLFERFKDSQIIVSYSSNSLPTKDEMIALLKNNGKNAHVIELDHRYSFGNQGHKINDNKNKVKEYLFFGI